MEHIVQEGINTKKKTSNLEAFLKLWWFMALYNLAFYCIYHLMFGKNDIFLFHYTKAERKRSYFKLRILTRYET